MRDKLYKKFKAVPTRPGRGGTYSYIKWQDVADRMNQIFGIKWSSEVVYQDINGSNVVTRVRVSVFDTNTGIMFFQEGFGGAPMDDRQEAGNPFKSAYSKALKDACKKWGVGLYLEEDNESITIPVEPFKATPIPLQPVEIPVVPNTQQTTVTVPLAQPITAKCEVQATSTNNMMPLIPPVPPTQPVSDNSMSVVGAQTAISDVQKAALQSILNIQGVKYSELIKAAFISKDITLTNNVPIMDDLSYDEAVVIIKYGNDNFRKH